MNGLLVLAANSIPAVGLYLWFKLTEKNLQDDWLAIFKDGLASALAMLWLGGALVWNLEGWPEYLGWGLMAWSLTFWASAAIAWQNLRAVKAGKPTLNPLAPKNEPQVALNRQQRRRLKRQKP